MLTPKYRRGAHMTLGTWQSSDRQPEHRRPISQRTIRKAAAADGSHLASWRNLPGMEHAKLRFRGDIHLSEILLQLCMRRPPSQKRRSQSLRRSSLLVASHLYPVLLPQKFTSSNPQRSPPPHLPRKTPLNLTCPSLRSRYHTNPVCHIPLKIHR